MTEKITENVTYVEMTSPEQLIKTKKPSVSVELIVQEPLSPELSESLYKGVGGDWRWIDRLPWDAKAWSDYVLRPDIETWTFWVEDILAGYSEFNLHDDNSVEIAQFGLLPDFIGQGLGGYLLTLAVEQAWEKKPNRVWLHTSTFDHPHALENYQARGFRIFKRETVTHYHVEPPPGGQP